MTTPELIIADALISHQLDLLRLGAYTQERAVALLNELGAQLERMLMAPGLTQFTRQRLEVLLKQCTTIIDQYYAAITKDVHTALEGVARVQASQAARTVGNALLITLQPSLPPATYLKKLLSSTMIQGARSRDWWRKQSQDTRRRFVSEMRQGLTAGETNAELLARVIGYPGKPGVLDVSKKNARALIHTSVQQVANESRLEAFRNMGDVVKGVRQLSTLDSRTTDICIAYSGKEWDLEGKPRGAHKLPFNGGPPRHWNCRSVLVPVTKSWKELGIRGAPRAQRLAPRFASAEGPTDMTMKQWLDSRTTEQLAEQLGAGRAKLYQSGKITINQLLDLRGNPLTLKQLERRAGL